MPGRSCTRRGRTSRRPQIATSGPLRPVFHPAAIAGIHRGDARRLERRLRRARAFPRAAHRAARSRSAHCMSGNTSTTFAVYELPELNFELSEEHFPTFGPRHRYGAVLFVEKEGFMPLFQAVKLGRALRPRHHVDEGDERHRQPAARRGAVRPARHPAPPPARLRQERLLHRRNAEAGHPPLHLPAEFQGPRPRSEAGGHRRARDRGSDAHRQRRRGGR